RATSERDQIVRRGSSTIDLPIDLSAQLKSHDARKQLLLFRVRYHISEVGPSGSTVDGILSLSEITPDLFELRVATTRQARPGTRLHMTIRAKHPITMRPASGVSVEGAIKLDDKQTIKSSGTTDNDGYAALDFDLPARLRTSEVDFKVTGRVGPFAQE